MSGSMRWFIYNTDGGQQFAIFLDESNTEIFNLTADVGNTGVGSLPVLPSNFKPRFIRAQDTSGLIKRKAVILTPARFAALTGGTDFLIPSTTGADNEPGTVVNISSKTGERTTRLPKSGDTAITDGDVP